MVQWIGQNHKSGCMAAVLAMLLDVDYDTGAALLTDNKPDILHDTGFSYFTLESVLVNHGFALARKYVTTQPGNKRREHWPVEPWADIHWCEVMAGSANGYAHAVVMLKDGSILDPITPEPKRLTDYVAVNFIAAVVKISSFN
jgi:hypothetical protein